MEEIGRPQRGRPPLPPEDRQSINFSLWMTQRIRDAVERQSIVEGVSSSDIVRTAIIEYLGGTPNAI